MAAASKKYFFLSIILILIIIGSVSAGPPFGTDDPEPVDFKHWEYYISSINNYQGKEWSGTAPHLEFNYGLVPNVQVHLLLPLNYSYTRHMGADFGYADTEFGFKFRFVQETESCPQIGIFPLIEIPTVKNSEFSDRKAKVYLPVWFQKSRGKLTTYGGGGYWLNPGSGNKNWIFTGWEVQYDFSKVITLGGEIFFHTADSKNSQSSAGFNIGGFLNPSEKTHILFSFGHTLTKDNAFTSYLGIQWTI